VKYSSTAQRLAIEQKGKLTTEDAAAGASVIPSMPQ